ncbi:MAG: ATP-binding protein [Gemmatimonadaceae bacterium]|nr:ATP-binding protein [Gemmatimonadaceae bacterium]
MDPDRLLPRFAAESLERALGVMPVAVLTGARQTGKSTLARMDPIGVDRSYFTLDDFGVLEQARRDPDALAARAVRITLDEVQRVPQVLLAIKRLVDEDRVAGRFLLTGSANLLLMKEVGETLAGRASYLTLWPMTRREQGGSARPGMWTELLDAPPGAWRDVLLDEPAEAEPWQAFARRGGYPVPACELADDDDRRLWFEGYAATYLERDIPRLSAIEGITDLRRLMTAACLRVGGLLNQADLARDVGLAPSTVQRYLNLLEVSFQLVRLPAWSVNRTKRLVKSSRLYWSDTGLALHLAGDPHPRGAHLENLVACDLLAWAGARIDRAEILFWRTTKGAEVDFVIETGRRLLPVGVKAAATVHPGDVRHLHTFLDEYSDMAQRGILLHDGEETFWLTDRVLAAPWWRVL